MSMQGMCLDADLTEMLPHSQAQAAYCDVPESTVIKL